MVSRGRVRWCLNPMRRVEELDFPGRDPPLSRPLSDLPAALFGAVEKKLPVPLLGCGLDSLRLSVLLSEHSCEFGEELLDKLVPTWVVPCNLVCEFGDAVEGGKRLFVGS